MHRIVVGLGFGDEGKGGIVDFLARERNAPALGVRFNGGLQAGHNVVTASGLHHTFSQFASCLFVPGTKSILSRHVFVDPFAMQNEAAHLKQKIGSLAGRAFASADCALVTPFHRTMNRIRELSRGGNKHGSCGVGVGEAFRDLGTDLGLCLGDLLLPGLADRLEAQRRSRLNEAESIQLQIKDRELSEADLGRLHEHLEDLRNERASSYIADRYAAFLKDAPVAILPEASLLSMIADEPCIFEGAQGMLLDCERGFFPHVTPSFTDARNALAIIEECGSRESQVIGVIRSYATRHGEGPLPTESRDLLLAEPHNTADSFQGRFRLGAFDLPLFRYALEKSVRVDSIALTHEDAFESSWPVCVSYKGNALLRPDADCFAGIEPHVESLDAGRMIDCIQEWAERPVAIASAGPSAEKKRFL